MVQLLQHTNWERVQVCFYCHVTKIFSGFFHYCHALSPVYINTHIIAVFSTTLHLPENRYVFQCSDSYIDISGGKNWNMTHITK